MKAELACLVGQLDLQAVVQDGRQQNDLRSLRAPGDPVL